MDYEKETKARLLEPFKYSWRAHGLGMLKTYLDGGQLVRLNLWHSCLVVPGTSPMHSHPWDLRSYVIAGALTNIRWDRTSDGGAYMEGRINCANFAGIEGEPQPVRLTPRQPETYQAGYGYSQRADEIHHTEFEDGTATIMFRQPRDTGGMASVFWPEGEEYGDASRDATTEEIVSVVSSVRAKLGL